jgi:hypothetical protein
VHSFSVRRLQFHCEKYRTNDPGAFQSYRSCIRNSGGEVDERNPSGHIQSDPRQPDVEVRMPSSPIVEDLDVLKPALFGFGFAVVILVIEQRCQHDGLVGRVIPALS